MSGNTFGKLFTVTTFGESHGPALGAIVDGCPPGLALDVADLQRDLDRRKPGQSRYTTQRREADEIKILSGVFEGQTTGTSIGLLIENTDQRSKDYSKIQHQFRPAHADYTYQMKYGQRDYRGGGRSSARETAMRVAAGAIAKKYLQEKFGVQIQGYLSQLGPHKIDNVDLSIVETNPFFCPDSNLLPSLESYMQALIKEGDSIGARINVQASNVPVGLGEPVFDRLDADIAHAMMGINAVKGVEIVDQELDLGRVELNAFNLSCQVFAHILVFLLFRSREFDAETKRFDTVGLHLLELFEHLRDTRESFDGVRLQRGFHLGEG